MSALVELAGLKSIELLMVCSRRHKSLIIDKRTCLVQGSYLNEQARPELGDED